MEIQTINKEYGELGAVQTQSLESVDSNKNKAFEQILSQIKDKGPYSERENNGMIEYKGIHFLCDSKNNAICLGDMSNSEDVITVPLSGGGCLKVNYNNLEGLSKAISMFSPEDIKRILQAITTFNKIKSMKYEIENQKQKTAELVG